MAVQECLSLDSDSSAAIVEVLKDAEGNNRKVESAFEFVEAAIEEDGEYATFGTEALWADEDEIVAVYLNVGDQYACTVCYDYRAGKFYLTDWEDFYQMLEDRYGGIRQR
jgi:hypothetical protein